MAAFATHRASYEDALSSQHPCEALAYCSGGAVNNITGSNTRGGLGPWNVFAAHCPSEALAYCFGGAPTEVRDSITWSSRWALSFVWGTSEPCTRRVEALTSLTLQRCRRSPVCAPPPCCPYMGRCPQGWHPVGGGRP